MNVSPRRSAASLYARHSLALCAAVYLACVTIFVALRQVHRPPQTFVDLVVTFLPFLFLPLLVLAPLALVFRSRLALACSACVAVIFAGLYGRVLVPPVHASSPAKAATLKVMTFNLGPATSDLDEVAEVIRLENPDILALEEVTPEFADRIVETMGDELPYRGLDPALDSTGFMSRYPVSRAEWIAPRDGGRQYVDADISWGDRTIQLIVVHPPIPDIMWNSGALLPSGLVPQPAGSTVDEIRERVRGREGLRLVAGDFNLADSTEAYRNLSSVLHDSFVEAGWGLGLTYPNNLSYRGMPLPQMVRIDYIFHSDEFEARSARVDCRGTSDHCYLVSEFNSPSR